MYSINYIFKINGNNTKYARFGARDSTNVLSLLAIKDESNTFSSQQYLQRNENYIELKKDINYYFNYTLFFNLNGWIDSATVYIFLMLSNYSNYIYVEKDKKEFDKFSYIEKIDLVLNISSIKKGNILIFEYNRDIFYEVEFSAYGYDTDDIENLPELFGQPLEITKDLNCYKAEICEGYIKKI